jgi:Tfp pilus assembly protein PilX
MNMKHRSLVSRFFGTASRQRGAVLLIALVVLVAMTLSALALIRSVNTTNLIAGNLAFRESALLDAERATQYAIAWLKSHAGSLETNSGRRYFKRIPTNQTEKDAQQPYCRLGEDYDDSCAPTDADRDAAGNIVSYVIHRLCNDDLGKDCSKPTNKPPGTTGRTDPSDPSSHPDFYYRITARVDGPRNTVVQTQAIVRPYSY